MAASRVSSTLLGLATHGLTVAVALPDDTQGSYVPEEDAAQCQGGHMGSFAGELLHTCICLHLANTAM